LRVVEAAPTRGDGLEGGLVVLIERAEDVVPMTERVEGTGLRGWTSPPKMMIEESWIARL
jgi:hypothetical protein